MTVESGKRLEPVYFSFELGQSQATVPGLEDGAKHVTEHHCDY